MKKKTLALLILFSCTAALAIKITDDIISRLGMQAQNAQWHIMRNLIGRYDTGPMEQGVEDGPSNSIYMQMQSFQLPRATLLASVISGDKSGAAKELCEYVKKYVNSEEFAAEYVKLREEAMPLTDRGMSLTSLKRNSEVHRINIKNYPNDTKYVAEQQQQLDENEKRVAALTDAAKKPFPGKEQWEKMYPADPALIVKKRLQEYIQLVATVDFSAKLTGSGRKQTFINPAYEKKSLKWKAIYRAGKEVNDAVTAFVKEWLKGEIISATKTKMTAQVSTPPPATVKTTPAAPATAQNGNTNTGTNPTTNPVAEQPTATPAPKQKKSLFNKIKEKTNAVIGN
ncbi:MAG: hypothetical protein NTW29_03435 [Bacteroidetes bacterium]|nr:hypothetical protein [Bacteroidota bacterium]